MKNSQGFTLIETLLYLGLFAIVIGGGLVAVYSIIQGTEATTNQVVLQEEANFLLRKIDWAMTGVDGASNITKPAAASPYTDTSLQVTKNINGIATKLTFCFIGTNLYLQRGVTACTVSSPLLNSSSVKVGFKGANTYIFKRTNTSPDGIVADFNLKTALNGRNATQAFSTTKYLRK